MSLGNWVREFEDMTPEEEEEMLAERAAKKEKLSGCRDQFKKELGTDIPKGVYVGKKYPNFIVRWFINSKRWLVGLFR